MKWRPISSAPHNELILLAADEDAEYPVVVTVGRYIDCPSTDEYNHLWETGNRDARNIPVTPHWRDSRVAILEHSGAGNGNTWELRGGKLYNPTHWMPLPKPPARKKR